MSTIYVIVSDDLARDVKLQATSEDKSIKQWVVEAIQVKLKTSDPSRRDHDLSNLRLNSPHRRGIPPASYSAR
jgi:hypothetical protein